MKGGRPSLSSGSGESLIEIAITLPLILILAINALNFTYLFYFAINIQNSARAGVEYSVQGLSALGALNIPAAGPLLGDRTVNGLVYGDLGAVVSDSANASVQVCTVFNGLKNLLTQNQATICTHYGPTPPMAFPPAPPDPESPFMILNQVDVTYTFKPLVNMPGPLGLVLVPLTIHRRVMMRALI